MVYFLLFLEGIITFVSPCLLPMLPIYISYFAGQEKEERSNRAVINALGFVLGFTMVFVLLGAFAGTVGFFLREHNREVHLVTGIFVILFGLSFLGVFRLPFHHFHKNFSPNGVNMGFFSAFLFGVIFSIGWTPCVGAFLGSALMLAAQTGGSLTGVLMLICFSLGLGIPFIITTILIDRLKAVLNLIKKNYAFINLISGIFLIIIGILMATGYMGYILSILSY